MYHRCQTLRHKITNALVRIAPKNEDSVWAWQMDRFRDAKGKIFKGDINDYTYIEDECGRIMVGKYHETLPDLSLKRYLVSPTKLAVMRRKALRDIHQKAVEFEAEVLKAMRDEPFAGDYINIIGANYTPPSYRGVSVRPTGISGLDRRTFNWYDWFMKRRGAKAIYRTMPMSGDDMEPVVGAYSFRYAGKRWVWEAGESCTLLIWS